MIRCDPVEFSGWLVVPGAPRFPAVQADRRSLVHSQHDSLCIRRIDPHRVVVVASRRAFDGGERMPAVIRTVQVLRRNKNNIGVLRIHENLAHIPIPVDPLVFGGPFPRRSRVVRPEQPAFFLFRLHNYIHALSVVSRRNRNSRSPPVSFGKSAPRDLRPRHAFVH